MAKPSVSVSLRLPPAVYDKIKKASEELDMSFNKTVTMILSAQVAKMEEEEKAENDRRTDG